MKLDGPGAGAAAAAPRAANDPATEQANKNREGAKAAAKQLEAFFLRTILAESRPQGGGGLDKGFAGDTFKSMLDEAIADKMSAAGGIGLSQMFAKQLGPSEEVAARPSAPIAGAPIGAADPLAPAGAPHFILPVGGRPTSGYGLRADPLHGGMINHPGFDLAAVAGTQVGAAAAGTVVHAGPAGTYGNLVTVRHGNGFESRYAHLSAVDVKIGDEVQAGQDLGKVGSTGRSTGPHLHFEVRQDGHPIDPAPLLPLNRSGGRTTR